jgi:tRNA-Thr(GGU) m(6)t(6)A37 methyltransferase TsaA
MVMQPIGTIKTCFTEKFEVPRQSLMIQEAIGIRKLNPNPKYRDALKHLEEFSHVWVIFQFHQHVAKEWTPTISPPRVDAPRKVGVFASRTPIAPMGSEFPRSNSKRSISMLPAESKFI